MFRSSKKLFEKNVMYFFLNKEKDEKFNMSINFDSEKSLKLGTNSSSPKIKRIGIFVFSK